MSFYQLTKVDLGFRVDRVLTFDVNLAERAATTPPGAPSFKKTWRGGSRLIPGA